MIHIPDANFIISALIKRGKVLELFEWNDIKKELTFVAPEYLSSQIKQNFPMIKAKSKLSESELIELLNKIELQIDFVPLSKFKSFIPKALEISPPDDFPYVALALFLESEGHSVRVLSNDKPLLKSLSKIEIKGITMHDLLRELKLV